MGERASPLLWCVPVRSNLAIDADVLSAGVRPRTVRRSFRRYPSRSPLDNYAP